MTAFAGEKRSAGDGGKANARSGTDKRWTACSTARQDRKTAPARACWVKVVDWTGRKEGGQRSTRVDKVER